MKATMQNQLPTPAMVPQIISQHFPLQVANEPFGDSDLEEASKLAESKAITFDTRILLHDMKLKIRLFDGYDWPEAQANRKRDTKALFVITETELEENVNEDGHRDGNSTGKNRSALMGSLLAERHDSSSAFADLPLPEDRVRKTLAQNDLRRLSRRTSTYVQISAGGISLRVDSFGDSSDHRLKSILRLSAKDFFLAETISTSNPVKMFGEWFNEVEHPRDSREGLLMFKVSLCYVYNIMVLVCSPERFGLLHR